MKRMRMSHSGPSTTSARKISKEKKKSQAQPIHVNTFSYVKKQNWLCGNGNFLFFETPLPHVYFSISLENHHKVANST